MAPAVAQSPLPASPLAAALPRASPRPISWERGWGSAFEEGDRFVAQPRALPMLFFDPPGVFGLKLPKAFVPKGVGEELHGSLQRHVAPPRVAFDACGYATSPAAEELASRRAQSGARHTEFL